MTAPPQFAPRRGDVVWLSLNPQAGREQAGRRPVVVLSPIAYNQRVGLALCCPITSQVKGYPFEVPIPEGLPVSGVVLADQIRNLDWRERQAELLCQLSDETVQAVINRLNRLLT